MGADRLEPLLRRVDALSIEEEGYLRVLAAEAASTTLTLRMELGLPSEEDEEAGEGGRDEDDVPDESEHEAALSELWEVECEGLEDWLLSGEYCEDIAATTRHPLLWDYTEPEAELFVYGRPEDPLSLAGALYERHQREAGSWIPFERYLNEQLELSAVLSGGYGKLADGPEPLLKAYETVLLARGIPANVLASGDRDASGEAMSRVEEDPEPWVLTFGTSWVIGTAFVATRLFTEQG